MGHAISAIKTPLSNISTIYGTKGYIRMPEYWKAEKIWLKAEGKEDYFEDPRTSTGYDFEVREVNRLIKEGKTESSIITYKKSIELMEILDEVREKIGLKYICIAINRGSQIVGLNVFVTTNKLAKLEKREQNLTNINY